MVIGLTGGMGSGKSTALGLFEKLGCRVINADEIAHDALKNNKKVYNAVIRAFGIEITGGNGAINRKVLGGIVFNDNNKRRKLESITHPVIIREIRKEIALEKKREGILVAEVPLLFEAGMQGMFDKTIVVCLAGKIALERIRKKEGITIKAARKRIKAQLPLSEKKKLADYILYNKSLKELNEQVKLIHNNLKS